MKSLKTIALALAVAASPAWAKPAPHKISYEAEVAAVKATAAEVAAGWRTKNIDRVMANFAEDATIMETGTPAEHGKPAARKYAEAILKDPNFSMEITPVKYVVAKSGDVAYVRGRFALTYSGPNNTVQKSVGSFIAAMKKEADGKWRVVEDISASDG